MKWDCPSRTFDIKLFIVIDTIVMAQHLDLVFVVLLSDRSRPFALRLSTNTTQWKENLLDSTRAGLGSF